MFKRIDIQLRAPICNCEKQNLAWNILLDDKGSPELLLTCLTCHTQVRVPSQQLTATCVLEVLYPADAAAIRERHLAKKRAEAEAQAKRKADEAAKLSDDEGDWLELLNEVTFDDVAGIDEAVAATQQLVRFLKDPSKYAKLGAKMPRGYLFHGPSGTGKTLLARAVAGEAGVHFESIAGSEFVNKYVGVGANRVRELFAEARKHGTAIIFIDEIDSVGGKRSGEGSGAREHDQTLNQLLVEMDGFRQDDNIVVIGATNQPDFLDPALMRPGRLTRKIEVPLPSEAGRRKILNVHTRITPLSLDVDLDELAAKTDGWSGAELADLVNEAAILAAEADQDEVRQADLLASYQQIKNGGELGKKRRVIGFGAPA